MNHRLLLVDDDPKLLWAMETFFRARGFDVQGVRDLRAAEDALAAHRFHLVITDLCLVESEEGLVVVAAARRGLPPIPVILLTAQDHPEISAIAEKLGATRVLAKPQSLVELLGVAQALIAAPPVCGVARGLIVAAGFMPAPSFSVVIFYAFAVLTVGSAAAVAFSSNIVYSAFALMGTLFGVAAMYVFLAADFVAAAQLLIYIGGILVLILFAVMLTHRIATVDVSNRSVGRFPALLVVGGVAAVMAYAVRRTSWPTTATLPDAPTTYAIGNGFLGPYVLPFELASFVLLAVLIGAIVISRKELKS